MQVSDGRVFQAEGTTYTLMRVLGTYVTTWLVWEIAMWQVWLVQCVRGERRVIGFETQVEADAIEFCRL